MTWTLDGKRAIVTGASSGIGNGTVTSFLAAGVRVAGLARSDSALRALEKAWPDDFIGIAVDLTDVRRTEEAVAVAIERLEKVDILVNCAGVGFRANLVETSDADYQTMFDVNVRAPFIACRRVIPHMIESGGGAIINVTSSLAAKAARDRAIYATTKAAVTAMTRSIAIDFGTKGIRANCVAPGTTDTPWIQRILAGAPDADCLRAQMAARQAVGRLGRAEEVVSVISFLASDAASFVHGASFAVDGGQTAW